MNLPYKQLLNKRFLVYWSKTFVNCYQIPMQTLLSDPRYEIEVIAVVSGGEDGEEKASAKIKLTTKQGKPETAPGRVSGASVREFTQALKFFWLPPSDKDCKNQARQKVNTRFEIIYNFWRNLRWAKMSQSTRNF